jgi:hypothetical protein
MGCRQWRPLRSWALIPRPNLFVDTAPERTGAGEVYVVAGIGSTHHNSLLQMLQGQLGKSQGTVLLDLPETGVVGNPGNLPPDQVNF